MKKVYLFLAVLGFSAPVFAQTFDVQITDKYGNDVTNGVYHISAVDTTMGGHTDLKFKIKNNGSSTVDVRVRRENVQQPAGYNNTICINGFCYPANQDAPQGQLTLDPGAVDSTFYGTFNNPDGTPVMAALGGRVVYAGPAEQGARTVAIRHDTTVTAKGVRYRLYSIYYHNSSLAVKVGARIKTGQVIARVGNTGRATNDHLHFELAASPTDSGGYADAAAMDSRAAATAASAVSPNSR